MCAHIIIIIARTIVEFMRGGRKNNRKKPVHLHATNAKLVSASGQRRGECKMKNNRTEYEMQTADCTCQTALGTSQPPQRVDVRQLTKQKMREIK